MKTYALAFSICFVAMHSSLAQKAPVLDKTFVVFHLGCSMDDVTQVMKNGRNPISVANTIKSEDGRSYVAIFNGNHEFKGVRHTTLTFFDGQLSIVSLLFVLPDDISEKMFLAHYLNFRAQYGPETTKEDRTIVWDLPDMIVKILRGPPDDPGVLIMAMHRQLNDAQLKWAHEPDDEKKTEPAGGAYVSPAAGDPSAHP